MNLGKWDAAAKLRCSCPSNTMAYGSKRGTGSICSFEDLVIVELKAVDNVNPVCHAQLISYLKLSDKSLGLLINFNVVHLRDGIKRFVRGNKWKKIPS